MSPSKQSKEKCMFPTLLLFYKIYVNNPQCSPNIYVCYDTSFEKHAVYNMLISRFVKIGKLVGKFQLGTRRYTESMVIL